ncbi:tetratricopeptide repeat protein [Streptomyces sp. NPDC048639]|uniref:tetratricopeptide repeat protein n=1 Tax=Streptomyces sp. NPDC048639 TaxID=3365581 RepID=UPI003719AF8C
MAEETPLIRSLRSAVDATPDDVPLRLHLAELLLDAGHADDAVAQIAAALQRAPGDAQARALMARAMGGGPAATTGTGPAPATGDGPAPSATGRAPSAGTPSAGTPSTGAPSAGAPQHPQVPGHQGGFDWQAAEREVGDVVPPRFVESTGADDGAGDDGGDDDVPRLERPLAEGPADPGGASSWDVEAAGALRLDDVGGMHEVKERLEAAFLAPMRNPELRKLYGKSLRGGLLLYGPPGCGKTFIARAVAGELGARFLSVSLSDVLDMWIGASERNLHDIFRTARSSSPCVLFLDEIDALGAKRSRMHHSGLRNTVNQLLTELDGVNGDNEGVFVLAATNHPWDVDTALRRPGRFDRTLLVLPPDEPAREAILRYHLRERPVAGIDVGKLVRRTDGFSGADLAHLCESASERALLDSVRTGEARMIGMSDLLEAAKQLRPSTDAWFASARNVAMFSNEGGMYDDLLAYLKRKRKL